eukprot:18067-Amphidinium_carterae.3
MQNELVVAVTFACDVQCCAKRKEKKKGQRSQRTSVWAARRKLAARRVVKLRCLRRAGAQVHQVARSGALAMRFRVTATMGLTAQQLQQDRSLLLRGVTNWPIQATVGMAAWDYSAMYAYAEWTQLACTMASSSGSTA